MTQSRPPYVSDRAPRKGAQPGWRMPSGHRLMEFVVVSGLAAPILALALKHLAQANWRRKGSV